MTREEEELQRVTAVAERLAARHPRLPLEAVCAIVHETRAQFGHGPTGDFARSLNATSTRGPQAVA